MSSSPIPGELPTSLRSITFHGLEPGPGLIVLGAVHGNETCGTEAILRLAGELERAERRLLRGTLTLVPITNPLAFHACSAWASAT